MVVCIGNADALARARRVGVLAILRIQPACRNDENHSQNRSEFIHPMHIGLLCLSLMGATLWLVTDANGPRLREKASVTGNVTVVWLGRMPESDAIGGYGTRS